MEIYTVLEYDIYYIEGLELKTESCELSMPS